MNINLFELKKLGKAKKAIEFLEFLSKSLKDLEFDRTDGFTIEPNKVSYFDIVSFEYRSYDFKEFNFVMCKLYYNLVFGQKIKYNKLFNDLILAMDTVYNNSKFYYYKDIYKSFHLVSWFIRSLRYSKKDNNKFDTDVLIKNFPVPFLEKEASLEENYNFIISFLNLLQDLKKIEIINLEISFINFDLFELDEISNISFEPLVFGGNLNTDSCILIESKIDLSILDDFLISEDYKFNYIISFSTNYISYDKCSNNLFIENIKCRV